MFRQRRQRGLLLHPGARGALARHFATKAEARAVITAWCHDFYNTQRRHSFGGLLPPIEYEKIAAIQPDAA
jgi:transposase InsO family protein